MVASFTFRGALGKIEAVAAHASPALDATQPPPTTPPTIRFGGTTLVQVPLVGGPEPPASETSVGERTAATAARPAAKSDFVIAHRPRPRLRGFLTRYNYAKCSTSARGRDGAGLPTTQIR